MLYLPVVVITVTRFVVHEAIPSTATHPRDKAPASIVRIKFVVISTSTSRHKSTVVLVVLEAAIVIAVLPGVPALVLVIGSPIRGAPTPPIRPRP